jgi:hypothetical protein
LEHRSASKLTMAGSSSAISNLGGALTFAMSDTMASSLVCQ